MPATEAPHLPIHPKLRYEFTDIHAWHVLLTGVGILVGMWILVALLYFFYAFLTNYRLETTAPGSARAAGRILEPPLPRLEVSPSGDLARLHALEDATLLEYHWKDQAKGEVTIPVERAIQLLAQRGIPPQKDWSSLKLPIPLAGTRRTGFEGKVAPEPR